MLEQFISVILVAFSTLVSLGSATISNLPSEVQNVMESSTSTLSASGAVPAKPLNADQDVSHKDLHPKKLIGYRDVNTGEIFTPAQVDEMVNATKTSHYVNKVTGEVISVEEYQQRFGQRKPLQTDTAKQMGMRCNGEYWSRCPDGQRFVCPLSGNAYCETLLRQQNPKTKLTVYGNADSYTRIGNTVWSSDGSSYTQIGNTVWGSDGTSYTKTGDTVWGSDGSSYTSLGNTTYRNDGAMYTKIGNTIWGSDGSSATQIGNTLYTH